MFSSQKHWNWVKNWELLSFGQLIFQSKSQFKSSPKGNRIGFIFIWVRVYGKQVGFFHVLQDLTEMSQQHVVGHLLTKQSSTISKIQAIMCLTKVVLLSTYSFKKWYFVSLFSSNSCGKQLENQMSIYFVFFNAKIQNYANWFFQVFFCNVTGKKVKQITFFNFFVTPAKQLRKQPIFLTCAENELFSAHVRKT